MNTVFYAVLSYQHESNHNFMKNRNFVFHTFCFILCNSIAILAVFLPLHLLHAEHYPDQFVVVQSADSLLRDAEEIVGVIASPDGQSIMLADSVLQGYVVLRSQEANQSFDRGLPSWNGSSPSSDAGFLIQMRFPYGAGWSSWLTVGFWKEYIWSSYGSTSYGGGRIDYDYVKLYSYQKRWQYRVLFKRNYADTSSPSIRKLSFFTSDSRTESEIDYTAILNDTPEQIFIPTTHLYQYSLDPDIGGSICSPTSVSMILLSYGIDVEPVPFARDTYDPHFKMFGIWPRVVQNASEYGLDGAVTRYRSWSAAREVLANGGRIAMSVGPPLYNGHLIMLAGFDENGNPLVHDPAKRSGYGYKFSKSDLSHSWFDKGGISYTFYVRDSIVTAIETADATEIPFPEQTCLIWNYPNPFNNSTTIAYRVEHRGPVTVAIYDLNGTLVRKLQDGMLEPGNYRLVWNGSDEQEDKVASGVYLVCMQGAEGQVHSSRLLLMK